MGQAVARFVALMLLPVVAFDITDDREVRAGEADGTEKVLFEDKFATNLGEGWSWVREDPKAWRVEKGELLIRSLPGALYREMNNCKNVLLRTPPEVKKSKLIVEVTLRNLPKEQFEHAGIVWYRDDDDYVVLSKEHYVKGAKPAVQMVREEKVNNKITSKVAHHTPYDEEQVSLRLLIHDTTFTGQYRKTAKEEWKTVGQITLASVEGKPRVGLVTSFGTKEVERWVHFSNFRILQGTEP